MITLAGVCLMCACGRGACVCVVWCEWKEAVGYEQEHDDDDAWGGMSFVAEHDQAPNRLACVPACICNMLLPMLLLPPNVLLVRGDVRPAS